MNIALICHVYPPEHAPAGVMVSELAENLTAKGHGVTVLTGWPNHPEGVLYPGWRMCWQSVERIGERLTLIRCRHSLHPRGGLFWRLWYYLTFAVTTLLIGMRAGHFDTVFSLSTPVFGCWTAWVLAKVKRARFVYGIFDLHPESAANVGLVKRGPLYRFLRSLDSWLCKRSDSVVTLGEGLKTEIMARGIPAEKIAVVPFWLDGKKVKPGNRENPWRREQKIGSELFVVLYAGTIGYVSGAEMLIETARLLSSRKDILFLCVGEGPIKNKLEVSTEAHRLKNIRFLPFQPAEFLEQVQSTADVGLVTLLPEASQTSLPSKVLGYMAAAHPIIASVPLTSDTAKIIGKAKCGIVTESQDASALANAIVELSNNPTLRLEMGREGRFFFEQNFDRGKCVQAYEQLFVGGGTASVEIL